jgi:hypothetical protein
MPGKNPASAIPSKKRSAKKEMGPVTSAIMPEMMPQVIMMRAIQILAPMRIRIMLLGTSKKK